MRMDIAEARAMLGVGEPVIYRECLRILEEEGNAAINLMGPQAQAQAA